MMTTTIKPGDKLWDAVNWEWVTVQKLESDRVYPIIFTNGATCGFDGKRYVHDEVARYFPEEIKIYQPEYHVVAHPKKGDVIKVWDDDGEDNKRYYEFSHFEDGKVYTINRHPPVVIKAFPWDNWEPVKNELVPGTVIKVWGDNDRPHFRVFSHFDSDRKVYTFHKGRSNGDTSGWDNWEFVYE